MEEEKLTDKQKRKSPAFRHNVVQKAYSYVPTPIYDKYVHLSLVGRIYIERYIDMCEVLLSRAKEIPDKEERAVVVSHLNQCIRDARTDFDLLNEYTNKNAPNPNR